MANIAFVDDDVPNIGEIDISEIVVTQTRLRRLRPDVVESLAGSMAEVGLLEPILVAEDGTLIAGWHRLEAAKLLGWESINASIVEDRSANLMRIMEIDENLHRAELSPAESAAHHQERKRLYLLEFPETKRGGAPGAGYGKGKAKLENGQRGRVPEAYTLKAAEDTGHGERTIRREVARATNVPNIVALAGTSLDKGEELDALAKIPVAQQAPLMDRAIRGEKVSAKTALKQIKRTEREEELAHKQTALPDIKFGVIVEDFEWDFQVRSRETGMDRHAANHYPVSETAHTAQEIIDRTADRFEIAAQDCVLFMWTTTPYLAVAIDVLRGRGFRYVSNYVWGKDHPGTGYWNRNKHEHLLIGVKGNIPAPAPGTQWDSLIMAPAGIHSAKPECFSGMIEEYFPNLPKLELNCRGKARPGWHAWGNEAEISE